MKTQMSLLRAYHTDCMHNSSAFDSLLLKRLIDGVKRVHGSQYKPPRKQVTLDVLTTVIQHLTDSFNDLSLKTALCVAFAGFLRSQDFTYSSWTPGDQLSKPTRSSIQFHNGYATLRIPYSKTDQERQGTTVSLLQTNTTSCPVTNLKTLFAKYPAPPHAPLFGRHSPTAAFNGIYFSQRYFANCLKSLLEHNNIDSQGFTSHSMRRGAAQSAANAGLTREEIQTLGRWKGRSVLRYVDSTTASRLSAAPPKKVRFSAPR